MTIQDIKQYFGISGTNLGVLVVICCMHLALTAYATDSTYTFPTLKFSITSSHEINGTLPSPSEAVEYPGVLIYKIVEAKSDDEHYWSEIRVMDLRSYLRNMKQSPESFWKGYELDSYNKHHPAPDTTFRYKNCNAMKGWGKTVSGLLHGTKEQEYRFIKVLHDSLVYSIEVFDTRKNIEQSLNDIGERISFIR